MTGKIIRIVPDKGFGFIKSDLNQVDYFFHKSEFDGHWMDLVDDFDNKEIRVRFDEAMTNKGPRAEKVRRLDGGLNI